MFGNQIGSSKFFVNLSEVCSHKVKVRKPAYKGVGKDHTWREVLVFLLYWNLDGMSEGNFILKSFPPATSLAPPLKGSCDTVNSLLAHS